MAAAMVQGWAEWFGELERQVGPRLNGREQALAWSAWRRHHQAIARRCHRQARAP